MKNGFYFNEDSQRFVDLIQALKGKKAVVIGHVRPDGDCIGSEVAMVRCLRSIGCDAVAINAHAVPQNCQEFLGDTPFMLASDFVDEGQAVITVDCADPKRLGKECEALAKRVYINVDHHISNTSFAEYNFIHAETSAAAEILAGFMLDGELEIDAVTAQALYVGMATDTGQFRFGTTTQQVFDICGELIRRGANPSAAAMELYEKEPIAKIRLLQHFLASLKFYCEGRVCIGTLDQKAWDESGARKEDTEGIVDYARSIEGVEIGILLEERDGATKGSFRAKDPVHRVDQLAKQFNGGGHACAAGFNPEMGIAQLYPKLIQALEDHFSTHLCEA